ncbi:MAG: hypothetical protein R3F43_19755 [bacterium]
MDGWWWWRWRCAPVTTGTRAAAPTRAPGRMARRGPGGAGGAGGAGGGGGVGGVGGGAGGAGGGAEACETSDDCTGDRIFCFQGRCVNCTGDQDCVAGTVCEAEECVPGCRDDAGCEGGDICTDGACVAGCRDDAGCGGGQICTAGACVDGCRDSAACPDGRVCVQSACVEGCLDDAGCAAGEICVDDGGPAAGCVAGCRDDAGCPDGLCIDAVCVPRGVACRADGDCGDGDRCDMERAICVPAAEECAPDALEPGPTPLEGPGRFAGLRICPGDEDLYDLELAVGDTLTVRLEFARANGELVATLRSADRVLAEAEVDDQGLTLRYEAAAALGVRVAIAGATAQVRNGYVMTVGIEAAPMCMDVTLYPDADADGFGVAEGAQDVCVLPDETPAGFARRADDRGPADPWRHPGAPEICSDWLDDDCDGRDAPCPESRPGVQVPAWACDDTPPPANVIAYARFPNGGGYFVDGGCFVFFEGLPGEFYVQRQVTRASNDPGCATINGCTCPSLNGWPAYDRRMYALTTVADTAECPTLAIIDHGGEQQPVSNDCRKYLYQMHFYDIPFSFVASGRGTLEQRLALFPTVEIACIQDRPHANLPYQSLLTSPIERNPGYRPLQ